MAEHALMHALPRRSGALIHADPQFRDGADHHGAIVRHENGCPARPGADQLTAPPSRRAVISAVVRPRPASTSRVSLPGRTGGEGGPQGVRANRGAGPGWTTPPTSMKVPRAALWGWAGASRGLTTGATHASEPANASAHSAWVRPANASVNRARSSGQPERSYWAGRPASSRPRRASNSA